ncbi:MAG: amino acid-binding protein [archaeon]|nr:amino acid-binding protein [archaeon]
MTKRISQLSIFVNNAPGSLAAIATILKDCGINMKTCNLAESNEFGILRAIVDEPSASVEKLRAKGVIVKETEILGVKIANAPGSLIRPTGILGEAGINIEYGYAFTGKNVEGVFMKVDDPDKAVEVLSAAGLEFIDDKEI